MRNCRMCAELAATSRHARRKRVLATLAALVGVALVCSAIYSQQIRSAKVAETQKAGSSVTVQPSLPASARKRETAHYHIYSTATDGQIQLVSEAVESLHAAYMGYFPKSSNPSQQGKLTLVLYKDRDEFKRNNRSSPWAEAYYLSPRSYAYYAADARNPHHWMIHEATHQLSREVSGFKRIKWIDEGLASYFGASRISHGKLEPGEIDENTYPIWWLADYSLTGMLEQDIASRQFIPLEQLITGRGGPDINQHFNQYYIHYWSLSHFLFHYRGGLYAERYKRLIAEGGSVENFRQIVGPLDRVQAEWYEYLLQAVRRAESGELSAQRNRS